MASIADIMQLCRLCLVKEQVNVPIFEDQDDAGQIFVKITACLPVKISKEDRLPKKICDGCQYKLDLLYQFCNTTTNAEKQLLSWLTAAGPDTNENITKTTDESNSVSKFKVNLKTEPNNESCDSLSIETKSYILQQQQLPYESDEFPFQEDDFEEQTTTSAEAPAIIKDVEQPPSKKRRTAAPTLLQEPPDESDEDIEYATVEEPEKTEEESEDDTLVEPSLIEVLNVQDEQPGPSGIGKTEAQCNPDDLEPIITIKEEQPKRKTRSKTKRKRSDKNLICDICSKEFRNLKHLNDHLESHNTYNCETCVKSFKKLLEYTLHRKTHCAEGYFRCINCEFETKLEDDIKMHLTEEHVKAPKYICFICKKGFNVHSWYVEHANFHTGEKPFKCEFCKKKFLYSRYLTNHRTSVHSQEFTGVPAVHECSICKKTYQHRNSLKVHMNSHTGNVSVCDICGKQLSSKEKLKFHLRIHTGYKPFKCSYCDKSFTKKTIMIEHERIHTGEKPYSCNFCEKKFSQRTSLVIHIRNHTGEKPYVCHICNKGFAAKAMLNIHFKSCKGV